MAISGQRVAATEKSALHPIAPLDTGLRIEYHDRFDGIDRQQWDELWRRSPDATIYQTFDWYNLWVKHFAPRQPLHILLAYRGERLVGACALCIRTQARYKVFRRRILTFVSSFSSAYPLDQGPLLDPAEGPELIEALAREILSLRGFAAVVFELFAIGSATERLLHCMEALSGQPGQTSVEAYGHIIRLPATHEAYIEGIGKNTRYNVRVAYRRFQTDGAGRELRLARDLAEVDELLTIMRDQKRQRFCEMGTRSTLDDAPFFCFLRELCPILFTQNRLMFQICQVDGQVGATQISFHDEHGHLYSYNSSFAPGFKELRLSYLLESERVREAIKQGFRTIELATGHDAHKTRWSQGNLRPLWQGQIVLHPWANLSFLLFEVLKRGIKLLRRGGLRGVLPKNAPVTPVKSQPAQQSR